MPPMLEMPSRSAHASSLDRLERQEKLTDGRPEGRLCVDGLASGPCLFGAFLRMGVAVDHLQIGQAPKAEKPRPWHVAMLAPELEERQLVVDLGVSQKPLAARCATVLLPPLEERHLIARRVPQPPSRHAGRVPFGVSVWAGAPEILMPAEAVDLLAADTAMALAERESLFAIRRGGRPKALRQPGRRGFTQTLRRDRPAPAFRRAASRRERPGQTIGTQRVSAPIAVDREPRQRRHERTAQGAPQDDAGEDRGKRSLETLPRFAVSGFAKARAGGGQRFGDPVNGGAKR